MIFLNGFTTVVTANYLQLTGCLVFIMIMTDRRAKAELNKWL